MNWTQPKHFVPDQNNLDGPKLFWTYRRIRSETFFENMNFTINIWKNVIPLLLSEFTGCEDEDALVSQYKVAQNDNQTLVIAGIVFNDDFDYVGNGDDKKMPDLDYKIRMDSREVVDLTQFTFTPYPMPPGPGRLFSKYLNNFLKWCDRIPFLFGVQILDLYFSKYVFGFLISSSPIPYAVG